MSKKGIEDKFSTNIDAYLNGIKKVNGPNNEEYNELLELGKTLANKDFSENSDKDSVFNKTLKNIKEYKGDNVMKKSNKVKKTVAAAAVFLLVGGVFTQTSFAKDLVKITNQISLGHISAVQTESEPSKVNIPDNLKGKIFDKNKKPVAVFSKDTGAIYTASGEQIESLAGGKITTVAEYKEMMDKMDKLTVRDVNSLNKYTCFNVKMPSYLPEGYKFNRAEFYKDKKGSLGKDNKSEIITLYFTNDKTGKDIFMQERVANKENKCEEASDEKVEKIKVNGVDAILIGNRSVDWEANGLIYGLICKQGTTKDEVIKIAQSVK